MTMLPKLTLRIKLACYLRDDDEISALQVALQAKDNSAQSPFAQIVLQSIVSGIWQNPLPLTGPAHSHTVDTN